MEQDTNKQTVDQQAKTETNCERELAQARDALLRVSADFENYKRRVGKERHSWVAEARGEVLLDVLAIVDDFDRALEQRKKEENDAFAAWLEGFVMIQKALYALLERYHVKPMGEVATFDPHYHEAIAQVASDKVKSGDIVEVVQRGFTIGDSVLRVAKVVVAQ